MVSETVRNDFPKVCIQLLGSVVMQAPQHKLLPRTGKDLAVNFLQHVASERTKHSCEARELRFLCRAKCLGLAVLAREFAGCIFPILTVLAQSVEFRCVLEPSCSEAMIFGAKKPLQHLPHLHDIVRRTCREAFPQRVRHRDMTSRYIECLRCGPNDFAAFDKAYRTQAVNQRDTCSASAPRQRGQSFC